MLKMQLIQEILDESPNLTESLKRLAQDPSLRASFKNDHDLYQQWLPGAKRYIGGEHLSEAIDKARKLTSFGHHVSLEYMGGENTMDRVVCEDNVRNILDSITVSGNQNVPGIVDNICFDLSTIGLEISLALTEQNLVDIATACKKHGCILIISMEEYSKVDRIIELYLKVRKNFDNIGITLQAYLHRTNDDLLEILKENTILRLVKGVYNIEETKGLLRGEELNGRYMSLLQKALATPTLTKTFVATHDDTILDKLSTLVTVIDGKTRERIFVEMLHGVRPLRLEKMKASGFNTCVYLTYGREWLVHFLHRLAEYPPNIIWALLDPSFRFHEHQLYGGNNSNNNSNNFGNKGE